MAIVGLILAVIGGIAFWWWRIQMARSAAEGVIDIAGKAKGAISRARFKHKAGTSVLNAVENPGVAAATLLYSLMAARRPVTLADEDRMDKLLERVCKLNQRDRDEAMAFAAWAAGQVIDTNEVVRRLLPVMEQLPSEQRQELVGMALDVAEADGPPTDAQEMAIRRLSEGLLAQ